MLVNFLEPGDRLVVGVCGVFGERIVDAAGRLGVEVERVDARVGDAGADRAPRRGARAGRRRGRRRPRRDLDRRRPAARRPRRARPRARRAADGRLRHLAQRLSAGDRRRRRRRRLLRHAEVPQLPARPGAADRRRSRPRPSRGPHDAGARAGASTSRAILAYWASGERVYHHTPPINTIYALREALAIVDEEGLEARWDRHQAASEALIAGLEALGMKPLVDRGRPPALADDDRAGRGHRRGRGPRPSAHRPRDRDLRRHRRAQGPRLADRDDGRQRRDRAGTRLVGAIAEIVAPDRADEARRGRGGRLSAG